MHIVHNGNLYLIIYMIIPSSFFSFSSPSHHSLPTLYLVIGTQNVSDLFDCFLVVSQSLVWFSVLAVRENHLVSFHSLLVPKLHPRALRTAFPGRARAPFCGRAGNSSSSHVQWAWQISRVQVWSV